VVYVNVIAVEDLASVQFVSATKSIPAGIVDSAIPLRVNVSTVITSEDAEVALDVIVNVEVAAPSVRSTASPVMAVVVPVAKAACAGETDVRTPIPRAATATIAKRLMLVLVDICFLSISQEQEFPALGFGDQVPSHMS
jgi:hypothetical protein